MCLTKLPSKNHHTDAIYNEIKKKRKLNDHLVISLAFQNYC